VRQPRGTLGASTDAIGEIVAAASGTASGPRRRATRDGRPGFATTFCVLCLLASPLVAGEQIFADDFNSGGLCGGWSAAVGASDGGCEEAGWQFVQWPSTLTWTDGCIQVPVYGITPSSRYLFTSCSPVTSTAVGDPLVSSIVDNLGHEYPAANDDCTGSASLPQLIGWDCTTSGGEARMFCAPPDTAGLEVTDGGVYRLSLTVCPFGGAGSAPLYIWWKGDGTPNPG